jgi:DNA-binding MarR family transcriptional regulator
MNDTTSPSPGESPALASETAALDAPEAEAPYRLHHSLGYHLSLAARLQERRLEEKLREIGLNRTTWCVLLAVANEGLVQPSDIADFVGIDRTATSRALRGMERDGLLARRSGEADRRTRQITLTDKGRAAVAQASPHARENGQMMADMLSQAEHDELMRLLDRLIGDNPGLATL